jgi:predicted outer membrane repeat protein
MKKTFLFLLLAVCFATQAQTIQVSGEQSGVWNADTVLVVGDVTVDGSLQVMPGTVVLFDGFYSISVGKDNLFKAQGTETDSIVFTVADTTGFHIYNVGDGGWNGFHLFNVNHFILDYCVLEYGKAADTLDRFGGALNINRSGGIDIRHTTFRRNFSRENGGAIFGLDSDVTLSDCSISRNLVYTNDGTYAMYGGGAQFLKCEVTMTGMEFRGNQGQTCIGGALSLDSCSIVLDRSVFVGNNGINGAGLYLIRSNHKECRFSNLLFDDNYSGHFGGGFAVADASPEISNVMVTNNESYGVSCCGIFFYGESSPILRNCIVYHNYPGPDNPQMDTTQMWIWTYEGFAPEFHNCLVEGGMRYIHSEDAIAVFENIIDADPMFVDEDNHDFHLAQGSPCINAGDPNTPQYVLDGLDLDGNPRVINQRIDIGPYESSFVAVEERSSASFAKLVGNPLDAHSRIEFDRAIKGEVTLSVYAITGRCVASKELRLEGSRSFAIGDLVERLAPGVYLIELKHGNEICTLKAVR